MKLGLRVPAFVTLLALAPLCGRTETLIRLKLPAAHSPLAVREMKAELGRVLEHAGLGLRWESASDAPGVALGQTISVSLLGGCAGAGPRDYEGGPLGWTKTAGKQVLPYVEIACERVESLIGLAWRDEPQALREMMLGRALARVLAHELAHAVSRTRHHDEEGLGKPALSPRDLMTGRYRMEAAAFRRAQPPAERVQTARIPEPEATRQEAPSEGDGR